MNISLQSGSVQVEPTQRCAAERDRSEAQLRRSARRAAMTPLNRRFVTQLARPIERMVAGRLDIPVSARDLSTVRRSASQPAHRDPSQNGTAVSRSGSLSTVLARPERIRQNSTASS